MINPYVYTQQNHNNKCNLREETSLWFRYTVEFPSAQSVQNLGNIGIKGEYYFPKKVTSAPLAILVHGMGNRSVFPCRLMARTLAKRGIASFILYLVFHGSRAPLVIKEKYPSLTDEEWFESYQISVTDIRQVIDWSRNRPEINQNKIGLVGISFGGLISSIAMALDRRIKAGILIVSGGNSEKITRYSLLLRWQYKRNKAEFLRNQESYFRYLAEVKEKGFENVTADKPSYLTDPMTFSGCLRNRPVLMLNALWDEIIPRIATRELWSAYGKPPISWYPATHASIWLWYPFMGRRIYGFLRSAFEQIN